jgi:hypothetical protein
VVATSFSTGAYAASQSMAGSLGASNSTSINMSLLTLFRG